MKFFPTGIIIIALLVAGCSGGVGEDAIQPSGNPVQAAGSHGCFGMWQFVADPVAGTLDVVPMRVSEMHLNALPFLEPPPLLHLTVESLQINGDVIDADIGLRHPFLGLTKFSGFDVCGVLITNGSIMGFDNTDLVMAGGDDTYLMNADGLTRWWNPVEFPQDDTILAYKDGLLGTPDGVADYNSTLNAYKFFCDDLTDPDAPVTSLDPLNAALFSPGQKNVRHYTIHLGAGKFVFNYAVDASWKFPEGEPPYEAPGDFGEGARRVEAWNISVTELSNTLFNDDSGSASGGDLSLLIDVWDHYNAGLNTVIVESPGNITMVSSDTPIGGGEGYSTYQVDITGATPAAGSIDVLIEVECEYAGYQGLLPGEAVTAYFLHTADVSTSGFFLAVPNGGEEWGGLSHQDITWVAPGSITHVDLFYSKDDFMADEHTIVEDYANSGTYDWTVPNDPSTTVKVKIVESGGTLEDESDDYFTILEGICDFGEEGFTLAGSYSITGRSTYVGVKVTHQDPIQKLIFRGSSPNDDTLFLHNADDPNVTVASYDTGDLIYCNNSRAIWIDPISEPGIDRILYNNHGGGSPLPGYQLKTIDWDGAAFMNPQTLPKHGSIWNLCVIPEGDLISHNANTLTPTFYRRDKSDNYSLTTLFTLQQSTCQFGTVSNIKDIVYSSILDAVILFCRNTSVSNGGQLFALDMTGSLVFEDLDIFAGSLIAYNTGIDIDINDPDCHVVVYAGSDSSGDATYWIARYSGGLDEKIVNSYSNHTYGPARGELCADGTLWAAWENSSGVHKFNIPPDW